MLDELRQIAIFAKTVDHGSFRAAAKALQLSPSVVSHHVAQLEQSLGTALLYRSTRNLALTPDGERLLESAHAMVEAAESGLQILSDQSKQPSGVLRITIPAIFTQSNLMEQLAEYALKYPKVELSLDLSEIRRDLILDGFDIAIRAGEMKDSSLKAQKLFQFDRLLIASPSYIESHPAPDSPSDLKDWDWLDLAPVTHIKPQFQCGRKRQTVQKKKSRISVNNAHALCQLSRAGTGLAIIPEYFAKPFIETGELVHVLADWSVPAINVFAVWPSNAPKNGLVKHLITFLKAKQTS